MPWDREEGPSQIVARKDVFFLLAGGAILGVKCMACRFLLKEQLWSRGPDVIGSLWTLSWVGQEQEWVEGAYSYTPALEREWTSTPDMITKRYWLCCPYWEMRLDLERGAPAEYFLGFVFSAFFLPFFQSLRRRPWISSIQRREWQRRQC